MSELSIDVNQMSYVLSQYCMHRTTWLERKTKNMLKTLALTIALLFPKYSNFNHHIQFQQS